MQNGVICFLRIQSYPSVRDCPANLTGYFLYSNISAGYVHIRQEVSFH
jgi:hypothetical protein